MQIHGRKCTYTTPQPLVSAYFPCDKQRAEKQGEEIVLKKLTNVHDTCTFLLCRKFDGYSSMYTSPVNSVSVCHSCYSHQAKLAPLSFTPQWISFHPSLQAFVYIHLFIHDWIAIFFPKAIHFTFHEVW